jgi:hypothetical protein
VVAGAHLHQPKPAAASTSTEGGHQEGSVRAPTMCVGGR